MTSRSGEGAGAGARDSRSERIALGLLLFTLALRPCLPETVSFETPSMTRSLDVPAGPMPGTTLTISGIVFIALGLAVAARVRRGLPVVTSWIGAAGGALLVVAAGVSAWHAGQKQLAVGGAISFLGCVATLPALAMVLTTPARVRLTACVILATGAVVAGRCIYQIAFDFPDTRAYFQEHRAEYEQMAGEAGGGRFYDFERRLLSDSATGYFAHSNVAASYLVLVVMVGVGMMLDRVGRARAGLVAPAVVAAAAAISLYFCRSKGGGAALLLALGLCALGVSCGSWISRRRRGVLVAFWLAALAVVGGVVVVGASRGGLPSLSLLYRWQYWRGAAGILADQGWLGIGSDNFGRWFTRFKPVECPEEVADPHSWIVRLAVEWGGLGLIGFVLVLIGASRRIARRAGGDVVGSGVGEPIVAWVGVVGAAVFLSWWGIYSDGSIGFLLLLLLMPFFVWLATAGLTSVEPGFVDRYRSDAAGRMLPALAGGAIGFAAHTSIDLGMFAPGAACTFFAVVAMAIACRGDVQVAVARPRPRAADAIMAGTLLAGLIYLIAAVRPATLVAEQLRRARRMSGPKDWSDFVGSGQYGAYAIASDMARRDATAADELIPLLLRRVATVEQADETLRWIDDMRARDPLNAAAWRHAAATYAIRSGISKDQEDLGRAIAAMRSAVEAYPTSPATRLLLAELLIRLNEMSPSAETAEAAVRELEAALALDEKQIYISKPHRISEERRAAIVAEIARLRAGQPSSAATKSS